MTQNQNFKSNFNNPYVINVSKKFGTDYVPAFEDAFRLLILQLMIQFMYFIKDPSEYGIFDTSFIELAIYSILGVCVYWLIFKRLVIIT